MPVGDDHPIQQLLFYISDDLDESDVNRMAFLVHELADVRRWVIGAPEFVDTTEAPTDPERDKTIRTVGGVLEIHSALPPWGDRLPKEIDQRHLEEVETVIRALSPFSSETGHDIAFELDGTQVGWIEGGEPDRSLKEGLLDAWRVTLRNR